MHGKAQWHSDCLCISFWPKTYGLHIPPQRMSLSALKTNASQVNFCRYLHEKTTVCLDFLCTPIEFNNDTSYWFNTVLSCCLESFTFTATIQVSQMGFVFSVILVFAVHTQALAFTVLHLTTSPAHLHKMDEMMATVLIINHGWQQHYEDNVKRKKAIKWTKWQDRIYIYDVNERRECINMWILI